MPAYEKVDGKWRGVWSVHVKVDGVWRDTDMSGKVDELWRSSHKHIIEEPDIVGFRLVYRVNPTKTHPDFPNLKTNLNMPIDFSVSGEDPGMNISTKGVLFHYERFGDEEGILMYEGSLYAVLTNGCLVDVGLSKNTKINNDDERLPGPCADIPEVWATSRMKSIDIQLKGYTLYESFRYHIYGWNSLFDDNQFINKDPYNADEIHRDINYIIPSRIMMPIEKRINSFNPIASIGIARNLNTTDTMIGAYGTLDHTVEHIKVNGIIKPFNIEIH